MTREAIAPGASVGVIGGGQLGRYFVLAARQLGYVTWVLDPDETAPAMTVAQHRLVASYDDVEALDALAASCVAVTTEFENVPAASLERLASKTRVAPTAASVAVSQDRLEEKRQALAFGLSPVPHTAVLSEDDLTGTDTSVGYPAILKTARLGYDGRGQVMVANEAEARKAFLEQGRVACVLEKRIELAAELSVVLMRGFDGKSATYPVAENVHIGGILHTSRVPSAQPKSLQDQVVAASIALADGLDYVGVLAVEFLVDADHRLWFNEMAPRPHNSGHYTLDATACSQFEQQLRALCALPPGDTRLLSPVCMLNLLGDVWRASAAPEQTVLMKEPDACLHIYGKREARPGRKMGHVNLLSSDTDNACQRVDELFSGLNNI